MQPTTPPPRGPTPAAAAAILDDDQDDWDADPEDKKASWSDEHGDDRLGGGGGGGGGDASPSSSTSSAPNPSAVTAAAAIPADKEAGMREAAAAVEEADVPPNGGYGWVCVGCAALINGHTWGLNSSYGVFLAYYLANDTFAGATYLDFAFVGGLSIACALLVSPLATTTTRVYGSRTTLLIGVFFETLSLITASFARKIWQLFLTQGVCFGIGMGFLFVGSVGIVPQWFTTRRSLANGISAAGSGFGGLVYSLAANAIIQRISLAWAFRILGIIAFVVNFTCACLMRDRNKQIGSRQVAFDYRMFKRPEFVLLQFWGFFSMLGYIVLLFSLPNYANHIGLTAKQGSVVGALLNLGQGLGRPPVGYFSDHIGRINMAMCMTFLAGLFTLVIWIFAKSFGVLVFFALIGGAVAGTFWATVAPVNAEVMGLRVLPSSLAITWLFLVLPCAFSEAIALEIVQRTSSGYLGAQLFAGFMYLAAAGSLYCVRVWKLGDMERDALMQREKDRTYMKVAGESSARYEISPITHRMFQWKKL